MKKWTKKCTSIIKKNWDKIEPKTQKWGLNWNNEVHMGIKLKSVQWHLSHVALSCHVTLTLSRVTTCMDLTRGNNKILKKN